MVIAVNSRTAWGRPNSLKRQQPIHLVAVDRRCCRFDGADARRVMQHVSSGDVQNAEASQDSDCPRLERWRWSPGVGAVGNCHIQITFLYAFEGKLLVLIAPVDETLLLSTADSRLAAVQARPVAVKDIAGFIRERYGRRRISSAVRRLMSKGPAPPLVATRCQIGAETQSQP
jgi:hypothetical protein